MANLCGRVVLCDLSLVNVDEAENLGCAAGQRVVGLPSDRTREVFKRSGGDCGPVGR
jgi:hypothetical protein